MASEAERRAPAAAADRLSDQNSFHPLMHSRIRRPERSSQAKPAALEDRFELAERLETFQGVITSHAASADASEGQILDGDVQQRIVDTNPARGCSNQYGIDESGVFRK